MTSELTLFVMKLINEMLMNLNLIVIVIPNSSSLSIL